MGYLVVGLLLLVAIVYWIVGRSYRERKAEVRLKFAIVILVAAFFLRFLIDLTGAKDLIWPDELVIGLLMLVLTVAIWLLVPKHRILIVTGLNIGLGMFLFADHLATWPVSFRFVYDLIRILLVSVSLYWLLRYGVIAQFCVQETRNRQGAQH